MYGACVLVFVYVQFVCTVRRIAFLPHRFAPRFIYTGALLLFEACVNFVRSSRAQNGECCLRSHLFACVESEATNKKPLPPTIRILYYCGGLFVHFKTRTKSDLNTKAYIYMPHEPQTRRRIGSGFLVSICEP